MSIACLSQNIPHSYRKSCPYVREYSPFHAGRMHKVILLFSSALRKLCFVTLQCSFACKSWDVQLNDHVVHAEEFHPLRNFQNN